jgi:hypothetical protein
VDKEALPLLITISPLLLTIVSPPHEVCAIALTKHIIKLGASYLTRHSKIVENIINLRFISACLYTALRKKDKSAQNQYNCMSFVFLLSCFLLSFVVGVASQEQNNNAEQDQN